MAEHVILAIDQGTTGTTSLVVDVKRQGAPRVLGRGYAPVASHYPHHGWVEQDAEAMWASVERSVQNALADFAQGHRLTAQAAQTRLQAVSLSNQRETALAWEADGLRPLGRAIVWQDRRTAPICAQLVRDGHEETIRQKTGLVCDPYFSASKWMWQLQQTPDGLARAAHGAVRLGTVDTYLVARLTGGRVHRTDTTNAARTGVFEIHQRVWDPSLCRLWGGVPLAALAEVVPSDALFGEVHDVSFLPQGLPIVGVLGDQHAALIGQGCCAEGLSKCTLGTGGFVLMHTGDSPKAVDRSLVQTIAYDFSHACRYALEGSTFVAGALIDWVVDLGVAPSPEALSEMAASVQDTGGALVVPALTGLGAPHWRPGARGVICGLGRETTRAHLARAALEGIALQTAELIAHMERAGGKLKGLRMDGGAAKSDVLLQMHADFIDNSVARPRSVEATSLGAALAGAVGMGRKTEAELLDAFEQQRVFAPSMAPARRQERLAAWQRAVQTA